MDSASDVNFNSIHHWTVVVLCIDIFRDVNSSNDANGTQPPKICYIVVTTAG